MAQVPSATKVLLLNEQLHEFRDKKTGESAKIELEIKKTDLEIDDLVYELYGLTDREIEIAEEYTSTRG